MSRGAVAVGVFDGVHLGHRAVLAALCKAGTPRVVTFDPHPVPATQLISGVERRLELLHEAGMEDVAVAQPGAEVDLSDAVLVTGPAAWPRRDRAAEVLPVPLVAGVSSERIRQLVSVRELEAAARMLGRPFELEGVVVEGDRRGRDLGFPTANLEVGEGLLVPPNGIYAGAALGKRAAISIGLNPHYGARRRRIEAYLLDFDGDLYGRALRLELWSYLRDEAAFPDEAALVRQIGRDVQDVRSASRPG
jgi:riboflavin kinase / FMN adenylyltransferase